MTSIKEIESGLPGTQGPADAQKEPALTAAEKALLDVLKDPNTWPLSVAKISTLAGISRQTYYNAFASDDFKKAYDNVIERIMKQHELPVIMNVLQKGEDPDQKSHHWAQMSLKMMGRLEEKGNRPTQINVVFNVRRPKVEIKADEKVIDMKVEDEE